MIPKMKDNFIPVPYIIRVVLVALHAYYLYMQQNLLLVY